MCSSDLRVEFSCRENACAPRGNPQQFLDAAPIDIEERLKHGRHEDRAPRMALHLGLIGVGIGGLRVPAPLLIEAADGVPQASIPSRGPAELLGQLSQQVLLLEVSTRQCDLVSQHLWKGEMLEQRHNVGKGLVKGPRVGVGRIDPSTLQPVEDGVRRLVGDDVVAEAREDGCAWQL